jgi:integrase
VDEEVQRELFAEAEARLILDAAEGEWKTLVLVGYYTGLRLATAAALRWDALDLAKKTISIRKPGKRGRAVATPDSRKTSGPSKTETLRTAVNKLPAIPD